MIQKIITCDNCGTVLSARPYIEVIGTITQNYPTSDGKTPFALNLWSGGQFCDTTCLSDYLDENEQASRSE